MIFKKKIITLSTVFFFTIGISAQEESPLECTPEETANYISSMDFNFSVPSNVPEADEAKQAFLDEKAESGDTDCLAVFSGDFSLDEKWKHLKEAIENIPQVYTSLEGAALEGIQKIYAQVKKQVMEELNKGICDRIDPEAISAMASEIAARKIEENFNLDIDDLRGSFESLGEDKLYEMYGPNAKYFYNPERYEDDEKRVVDDKIKEVSKDFWDNL